MINFELVQQQFGMEKDFILSLLDDFQEMFEQELPQFQNLLLTQNYYDLSRLAHKHKSSAFSLGIAEIGEKLKAIELSAKSEEDADSLSKQIDGLEQDFKSFSLELEQIKSE